MTFPLYICVEGGGEEDPDQDPFHDLFNYQHQGQKPTANGGPHSIGYPFRPVFEDRRMEGYRLGRE